MNQLITIEAKDVPSATRARSDAELLSAWLKSKTDGGSEHTARLYSRVGEAFLAALGRPLRESVVEDVQAAVEKLRIKENGKSASAATVATHLAVVKSFLRFAHRVGYTRFNAGELLKVKKIHGARAQRIMQKIDVQLLLRCAGSLRNRLLLAIAYYGALRVSELASLTWGHFVEREGGRVQIAGLVGKGDKEREVLLPASVAVLIRQSRGRLGRVNDDTPVFISRQGTQLSERMINHVVKAAAKRAGLPPKLCSAVSPHWLRHAHASHALDNGAPIQLVSQTLGHGSISTTSIYAHARPNDSSALYLDETS